MAMGDDQKCALCRVEFAGALWCRVINCPCTDRCEPDAETAQRLGWRYTGFKKDEGPHALVTLKPKAGAS